MIGQTYIRIVGDNDWEWKDLFAEYKVSLSEEALSKLMTPAPNKQPTENTSDLMHGKRFVRDVDNVRKNERNFQLMINLIADTKDEFLCNYCRFCKEVLDKGYFDIYTKYNPCIIYRLTYVDCQQFSEFMMNIAKFNLSLNEPDPTNRGEQDKWEQE